MNGVHIKVASLGFRGYFWRVTNGTETHIVHACDNYTAAEACGWKFGQCDVQEMKLVPRAQS